MTPAQIEQKLERILPRVTKPGRYTGGEYNQIVKNWDEIDYDYLKPQYLIVDSDYTYS